MADNRRGSVVNLAGLAAQTHSPHHQSQHLPSQHSPSNHAPSHHAHAYHDKNSHDKHHQHDKHKHHLKKKKSVDATQDDDNIDPSKLFRSRANVKKEASKVYNFNCSGVLEKAVEPNLEGRTVQWQASFPRNLEYLIYPSLQYTAQALEKSSTSKSQQLVSTVPSELRWTVNVSDDVINRKAESEVLSEINHMGEEYLRRNLKKSLEEKEARKAKDALALKEDAKMGFVRKRHGDIRPTAKAIESPDDLVWDRAT